MIRLRHSRRVFAVRKSPPSGLWSSLDSDSLLAATVEEKETPELGLEFRVDDFIHLQALGRYVDQHISHALSKIGEACAYHTEDLGKATEENIGHSLRSPEPLPVRGNPVPVPRSTKTGFGHEARRVLL